MSEKRNKRASFDEDVYEPIPESKRVPWPSMMMIFVGMWVSLYSVAIGYHIGMNLSAAPAIWSCILGYGIAGIIAALMGEIGRARGLPSYVLAKGPLQWYGQTLIALVMFTVIGFGSIGLQADAVGRSIGETYPTLSGSLRPLVSGLVCAMMMLSAILGIRYMAKVSWVTMPFFFVISLIATFIAVRGFGGLQAALAVEKTGMDFSYAVFLNAGAWGGFVMLMADVSRFLKSRSEALTVIPIAFLIGAIPPICGVLLGATIQVPLEALFPTLGLGFLGLLSIIGIGWTTNDNNAYTAGLALCTAIYPWKRVGRMKITMIVAVLGVMGAITGIGRLSVFEWIAGFHGSYNMSFVGVLIAHYYIVSKDRFVQTNGFSGLVSWLLIGTLSHFRMLPVPFITATLFSLVLYLILYYAVEKPLFGERVEGGIEPKAFVRSAP
ncbi:MAG: hypothetical protein AB1576_04165 [Bacillota bacterium]